MSRPAPNQSRRCATGRPWCCERIVNSVITFSMAAFSLVAGFQLNGTLLSDILDIHA
jgi:hypothetical protein